jgi:hypothetical protein
MTDPFLKGKRIKGSGFRFLPVSEKTPWEAAWANAAGFLPSGTESLEKAGEGRRRREEAGGGSGAAASLR